MEKVNRTRKASKSTPEDDDVISSMPKNVITHFLDCLPIQDAVRTGILGRNWRFKWTMLTQLIIDDNFFEILLERGGSRVHIAGRTISRLLLHLKGPITKFVLHIPLNYKILLDAEDINHWVMFLSGKGIKELSLLNMHVRPLKLPTHLFSCLELKHLKLRNCSFHPPPTFCGFPNLLSLDLYRVTFVRNWGEIITQCPLLEVLKISYDGSIGQVLKLSEFVKLENLTILHLPVHLFGYSIATCWSSSLISRFGGYVPKLQELNLDFRSHKFYGRALNIQGKYSIPCLKTLTLSSISFNCSISLSIALEMIWMSPNLQTLKITAKHEDAIPVPAFAFCPPEVGCRQLRLRQVVLEDVIGLEAEVCLIKSLLDSSPSLTKMVIRVDSSKVFAGETGKMMFATKLLQFRRASALAEVDVYWF